MVRVKLEDVCERGTSNLKMSDVTDLSGNYPIYGAAGYIGNVDFYHQINPYVAIVKDGAGIGRAMLCPAQSSIIGTMQYLLPKKNILPRYLYYVVKYMHLEKYFTGATIPHIYFKDYKNETFNLEALERQKEIVTVLEKCEKVIEYRKRELNELDSLIKARFVELFCEILISMIKNWKYDAFKRTLVPLDSEAVQPRPIEQFLGGDVPWIKIGDATDGDSIYLNSTKEHIIQEGIKKSRLVKEGSLNIMQTVRVSLGLCERIYVLLMVAFMMAGLRWKI